MKYAICNETFENWDHARVCQAVARFGYQGLEVAPFTLAPRITDVPAARRLELRRQAEDAGLQVIGLHWLLAKTEGMQVTSPEPAVRQRTADYLVELARACRDLGGDLMVFGSPAQRRLPAGHGREKAVDFIVDTFRRAARGIADQGVRLCLEPLSPPEADFINTCDEALEILGKLGQPHFVLHLDVKAMSTEEVITPELISRHGQTAGHFHANDVNRRGPGFGATDFVPVFRALKQSGYGGWVSLEVFDYSPDPETIARESIRYMKECEAKVA
jgi:sugar phosphate isomerase/epimerase